MWRPRSQRKAAARAGPTRGWSCSCELVLLLPQSWSMSWSMGRSAVTLAEPWVLFSSKRRSSERAQTYHAPFARSCFATPRDGAAQGLCPAPSACSARIACSLQSRRLAPVASWKPGDSLPACSRVSASGCAAAPVRAAVAMATTGGFASREPERSSVEWGQSG